MDNHYHTNAAYPYAGWVRQRQPVQHATCPYAGWAHRQQPAQHADYPHAGWVQQRQLMQGNIQQHADVPYQYTTNQGYLPSPDDFLGGGPHIADNALQPDGTTLGQMADPNPFGWSPNPDSFDLLGGQGQPMAQATWQPSSPWGVGLGLSPAPGPARLPADVDPWAYERPPRAQTYLPVVTTPQQEGHAPIRKRYAPDLEARDNNNKRPRTDRSVLATDVETGEEVLINRPGPSLPLLATAPPLLPPHRRVASTVPFPSPPTPPASRPWHKKKMATTGPVHVGKPTDTGKGFFYLPQEIRQQIFRLLLLAREPIRVSSDWSEVSKKAKLGLHTVVLGVNKLAAKEGKAVLYGENTFAYSLRDAPQDDNSEELIVVSDRRIPAFRGNAQQLRNLAITGDLSCGTPEHARRLASSLTALATLRPDGLRLAALTLNLAVRLVRDSDGRIEDGALIPGHHHPWGQAQELEEVVEEEEEEEGLVISAAKHKRNRAKNRPPPAFLRPPTERLMTIDFFDPRTAHGAAVLAALRTVPADALGFRVSYAGARYLTRADLPATATATLDGDDDDAASLFRRLGQLRDRATVASLVADGRFLWTEVQRRRSTSHSAVRSPPTPLSGRPIPQPRAAEMRIREAAQRQREEQRQQEEEKARAAAEEKAKVAAEERKRKRAEKRKAGGGGEKKT